MNGFVLTTDIIVMLLPLVVMQIGLAAYCTVIIIQEGVQNLNKWAWLSICLFVSLLGPVTFLIVGRKKEYR